MNWFRVYSEARNDRKLRELAADEFRVWFNLLCLSSDQPVRGSIAADDAEILALEVADGDSPLLDRTLKKLVRLRIIRDDERAVAFIHWDERQYSKPSDRPDAVRERVARHRERRETPSADDVTPSNAEKRPITDTDTDTDTDTEQRRGEETQASPAAAIAAVPKKPRRQPKKAMNPDLQRAMGTWTAQGLGSSVSMNAQTGLRELIAAHGIDLVIEGITKAAEQNISGPVAWMRATIPAWIRQRSSTNGQPYGNRGNGHVDGSSPPPGPPPEPVVYGRGHR